VCKKVAPRWNAGRGSRLVDNAGLTSNSSSSKSAIRVELAGSDRASACGLVAVSTSPVLLLCRMLVDSGVNPVMPLQAWRGPVLCLRVRSIGEGTRLQAGGDGIGFRPLPEPDTGSPMHQDGSPRAKPPGEASCLRYGG
jgi:hypothetical protein